MSNSNEVQISYVKQVALGVIPSANLKRVNYASESLKGTAGSAQSAIVDNSGNVKDLVRTSYTADGGINTELGFGYVDDFLIGAWRSAFETPISLTGITFSIGAAGSPITLDDSANGLGGLLPDDIIMVSGFADENNNGAFAIGANVAAGSVDIVQIAGGKTPVTEAAGASVTIKTTRMANANTDSYFAIERFYSDVSEYMSFIDMHVDTLTIEFGAGAIPTVAFTFKGTDHPPIVATIGTGYVAASTADVINTDTGYLGTILGVNGAVLSTADGCVTKVSISVSDSIRVEEGLNCQTIGKGDFDCKVSFDMVFSNQTYYNVFQNDGFVSMALAAVDGSNQGIGLTFPKLKFTDASAPSAGRNNTVSASYSCQASKVTVGANSYTAIMSILE
jgi:hypothetical protein